MQDGIHRRDAEHGLVGIAACEHFVFEMLLQFLIGAQLSAIVLTHVTARPDEEAARPAGGVCDAVARLRLHEPHHHADDVTRRTELSDTSRRLNF